MRLVNAPDEIEEGGKLKWQLLPSCPRNKIGIQLSGYGVVVKKSVVKGTLRGGAMKGIRATLRHVCNILGY